MMELRSEKVLLVQQKTRVFFHTKEAEAPTSRSSSFLPERRKDQSRTIVITLLRLCGRHTHRQEGSNSVGPILKSG